MKKVKAKIYQMELVSIDHGKSTKKPKLIINDLILISVDGWHQPASGYHSLNKPDTKIAAIFIKYIYYKTPYYEPPTIVLFKNKWWQGTYDLRYSTKMIYNTIYPNKFSQIRLGLKPTKISELLINQFSEIMTNAISSGIDLTDIMMDIHPSWYRYASHLEEIKNRDILDNQ